MSFLSELKQRRVIRALIAYLVAAWVAIEVATTVSPLMGLPEWVPRLVLTLASAGLPAVLLLAWYFDWDAGRGLRRAPVPESAGGAGHRTATWTLGAVASLLLAGAGFGVGLHWDGGEAEARAARVVVGVFENRTGDDTLAPLGQMATDWVTQGLIEAGFVEVADPQTALAIERTRASTAGVLPPDVLAREAMASLVVYGSYYRLGDSLWINAEVRDVVEGRVVAALPPVAAHRADPLRGVEDVRQRVVTALALQVDRSLETFEVAPARPPSWSAYSAYMEGLRAYLDNDYFAAAGAFDRAIAHDSMFDSAILWSAHSHWFGSIDTMDARISLLEPRRSRLSRYDRARLDWMRGFRHGDLETIYRANREVVAAAPGSVNARREFALAAMRTHRYAEAREIFDSLYPFIGLMRSWSERYVYYTELLHLQEDYEREAEVALQGASDGMLDRRLASLIRARAAAGAGDAALARALTDSSASGAGDEELYIGRELVGHGATTAGEELIARAIERLERAAARSAGALPNLAIANYTAGRYDDAESTLARLARTDTTAFTRAFVLDPYGARIAAQRGDYARAVELTARDAGSWWFRQTLDALAVAPVAALRGESERSLEALRRSADVVDGNDMRLHASADPDLASLRGWAPFEALMRGEGPH